MCFNQSNNSSTDRSIHWSINQSVIIIAHVANYNSLQKTTVCQ